MTFQESIAAIPFNPNSETATGILPPIVRAMGHILFVVASLGEEFTNGQQVLSPAEQALELNHAKTHLFATLIPVVNAPLSTAAKDHIAHLYAATDAAFREYEQWDADARGPNLKSLADRAAALAAILDGELIGLRTSDPGRTL